MSRTQYYSTVNPIHSGDRNQRNHASPSSKRNGNKRMSTKYQNSYNYDSPKVLDNLMAAMQSDGPNHSIRDEVQKSGSYDDRFSSSSLRTPAQGSFFDDDPLYDEPIDMNQAVVVGKGKGKRNYHICGDCGLDIKDERDAFEIEVLNKWFHADCFCCDVCKIIFDDHHPFVPHEGKALCEQHFEEIAGPDPTLDLTCAACNKPITDGKVSHAFGRVFHEKHLRCHICKHRILGPHVEHNGKAFCQQDYERLLSSNCTKCTKPIEDDAIHACGSVWHRSCFGCTTCSKPFPDKKFFIHDSLPFCLEHYHEASNTLCGSCSKAIQGPCVQVEEWDQKFHPECWTCATCKRPISGVYYSYRGRAYCEHDVDRVYGRGGDSGSRPSKQTTLLRKS